MVALEGTRGIELEATARVLARSVSRGRSGGVSKWSASGVFDEILVADPGVMGPSPRTLILLYATDLFFRLRWQIEPALAEGRSVVAAPYVESAIAFGNAAGLPRGWMADLFRFAPKPDACYRLKERAGGGVPNGKPRDGYLEFCCAVLRGASRPWKLDDLRDRAVGYLSALERRRRCETLTERVLAGGRRVAVR